MSEKQKKMLGRIIATLILFVVLLVLEKTGKFDAKEIAELCHLSIDEVNQLNNQK